MDVYWVWLSIAILSACYFFVNKFVRSLNEWYYDLKLRKKQHPLPPGDMGWPFIGNILIFLKDFSTGHPDSFVNNLVSNRFAELKIRDVPNLDPMALRYGPTGIYKTHLFGNPSIIICEPEMCKQVLTNDENFKIGYPKSTLEVTRCRPMWNYSREEHRRFRRLISAPIMGHVTLEMYLERIEDIVIKSLEELSSMKNPIEFLTEMKKVSFKVIIHIFMGSYNQHIVTKIGNSFTDIYNALFSMPINLPGFAFRKGLKAREKLAKLVQPIVEERRLMVKNGKVGDKRDLVDILLEAKDEDGWKFKDEDIIDILIGLVLAGHEATASGMMWSITYLTQHPHILKKAKEEQEEIIKRRLPTQNQLNLKEIKQMVYLSHVIDEMLRLVSNNFSTFREATVDVNINGYLIPKGWKVLTWLRAIHMNPDYYPNPNEFNPSRWDDHSVKVGTFLPFGAGSRLCPGRDLAKIEISVFLHYFLLNYKLVQVNPKCPVTSLPTSKPTDNCLAKVIKVSPVDSYL